MRLLQRLLAPLACAALMGVAPNALATANFQGLWCGTGLLRDFSLKLHNGVNRNEVEGTLMRRDRARELHGSVEGSTLRTEATKYGSLVLTAMGGELKITGGDGPLALARGNSFRRASGEACSR